MGSRSGLIWQHFPKVGHVNPKAQEVCAQHLILAAIYLIRVVVYQQGVRYTHAMTFSACLPKHSHEHFIFAGMPFCDNIIDRATYVKRL